MAEASGDEVVLDFGDPVLCRSGHAESAANCGGRELERPLHVSAIERLDRGSNFLRIDAVSFEQFRGIDER